MAVHFLRQIGGCYRKTPFRHFFSVYILRQQMRAIIRPHPPALRHGFRLTNDNATRNTYKPDTFSPQRKNDQAQRI